MRFFYFFFASYFLCYVKAEVCQSNCQEISFRGMITNLWKLCGDMTPLLNDYKNSLISLTNFGETYQSMILGQTMLAVEKFTNSQSNMSMSCLYMNLIKQTTSSYYGNVNVEEYDGAWKDFKEYAVTVCDNSLFVGLAAAGCISLQGEIYAPEECPINESVLGFVKMPNKMPQRLKSIIRKLLASQNSQERDVGLAAVASTTTRLTKIFDDILLSDNRKILNALKILGCVTKIPMECCGRRGIQIQNGIDLLKKLFIKYV